MAQAQALDRVARCPSPGRAAKLATVTLTVENMNCGGCMGKVERALMASPGVAAARANLAAKRVSVTFEPPHRRRASCIAALGDAGFNAAELVAATSERTKSADRDFLARLGVAGFAAANVMLLSVSVWAGRARQHGPGDARHVPLAFRADRVAGRGLFRPAVLQLRMAGLAGCAG